MLQTASPITRLCGVLNRVDSLDPMRSSQTVQSDQNTFPAASCVALIMSDECEGFGRPAFFRTPFGRSAGGPSQVIGPSVLADDEVEAGMRFYCG